MSYTETICPPAWSLKPELRDYRKMTDAGLLVGIYIVILQPKGFMNKQYIYS